MTPRRLTCAQCGAVRVKQGPRYVCLNCKRDATSRYRQMKPESRLWSSCRARARRQGVEFSLQVSDIVIPDVCPVLGIKLDTRLSRRGDSRASVDRINPSGGYTPDNTVVVSWRANRLKSDATLDELARICVFYRKKP